MILEVDGLSHRYGEESAVENASFGLEAGELVALLGPSGCGKTTVVQAIAGHVRPTAGRVSLRGEDVTDAPPESRGVGVVFQRSTLYPHMTVGENVAYGLAAEGIDPDRRRERVREHLELVDLRGQRDTRPDGLSGGQKRRAELARALAPRPDVLLLDEPLSALDRALRGRLREEIGRIQRETGVTTLFVTHDQAEAMALADRLVVMNGGSIAAVGEPGALYRSPPSPFVASFLGRSNDFRATVVGGDRPALDLGGETIDVGGLDRPDGDRVRCHVRPEAVSIRPAADPPGRSTPGLCGEVVRVADLGRRYDVTVRTDPGVELLVERADAPPSVGDRVAVAIPEGGLTVFDA